MKTNDIFFSISFKKLGLDGFIACDNIYIFDGDISFFVKDSCISCFSLKLFDLVYTGCSESCETAYFYNLVKR